MYIVYILRCSDRSLYTGITNDLPKRFAAHQSGKGGNYTRSHPPRKIVYTEDCGDKGSALKREAAIKSLPRSEKQLLINRKVK